MHGRRVFRGAFWVARTVRYPTHLQLAGAQVWSLTGSQSQAPALRLSLALRFCVSVVAEGDVDVEAIVVSLMPKRKVSRSWIMLKFSLMSKLLLSSMPEVMVLRIDDAFARSCGGTATGCRT